MTARETQTDAARRLPTTPDEYTREYLRKIMAATPTRTNELQPGMFVFDPRDRHNVREHFVDSVERRGVWFVSLRWTWGGPGPLGKRTCASDFEWLVVPQPSYWRPLSPEDQAAHDAWTREARARIRADHVNRGYQRSR